MALGSVSSTVAITSIASSFDNRCPVLPDLSVSGGCAGLMPGGLIAP
jgi:hypothetical protein